MINKEDLRVGSIMLYTGEPVIFANTTTFGGEPIIEEQIEGIPLTEETIKKYFPEFEYNRKETYECVDYSFYRLYRNEVRSVFFEIIFASNYVPQITIKREHENEIVLNNVPFVHNLQNILQALKR